MTYCVGIKTKEGIVVASDSRTNAGLDNVNIYSKMLTYDVGDRTIIVVTSGNLATSQAVFKTIEKDINEMIIKGNTKEQVQKIITDNTYSGLSAITQLNSYKRC